MNKRRGTRRDASFPLLTFTWIHMCTCTYWYARMYAHYTVHRRIRTNKKFRQSFRIQKPHKNISIVGFLSLLLTVENFVQQVWSYSLTHPISTPPPSLPSQRCVLPKYLLCYPYVLRWVVCRWSLVDLPDGDNLKEYWLSLSPIPYECTAVETADTRVYKLKANMISIWREWGGGTISHP